jgi:hypothetical protein
MRGDRTSPTIEGVTVTHPDEPTTEAEESKSEMEQQAEESFDLRAKQSGSMGGGASGPRDMPTGGRGQGETSADIDPAKAGETEQTGGWGTGTQGSSNVAGQQEQETGQAQAPADKGQEEIENYGSRRDDEPDELLSPSSQIGRAAQSGGTPESGRQPDEDSREGWPMPDQGDTPKKWPDPTTD